MKLQDKKIAIVGGGPGGLTLARLLQLKDADVKVYERDFDATARVTGSPLDMHKESGLAAIIKAELLDVFRKTFRPGADKMVIADDHGTIAFSDHDTNVHENFGHEHFRPEIDRGPLRNMLLDSLKPETVVWDSHFISMDKQGDGWNLHFKNGSSAYADIVIGSDGANSKIRPYITPIKPVYSGITMIEVNVHDASKTTPDMYKLLDGGKIMAFGNEQCILGGQKGNGNIGFYLSLKTNLDSFTKVDFSNKIQVLEWFTKTFSNWSDSWQELIGKAEMPFIPRPIYYMPLDQTWKAWPNLTIIGDAAHVMPPFAGEGANMAMLDALELSEALTSDTSDSIEEAIAVYETNMRQRAAMATQESIENGEKMHSAEALKLMVGFFG
ncbi:FAD-dependent oxidoreductase [Flavobacterium silvaticum]|uniref:Flavin-dependent monooxygenase n=1 Tax=Flavobacterium silvaticum TaxID=1852020 RepID=A0A972JIC4_9FLAO|nr:NAD(P)/FAD-dependent oxidoreductase [Flavobacterium silvaticum]NMH28860.1 FAD-dependent monooxygenase [Flavobacterium silvaticum]